MSLRTMLRTLIPKYFITSSESSVSPDGFADLGVSGCQLIKVVVPECWVALAIPSNKTAATLTALIASSLHGRFLCLVVFYQ